MKLINWYSGGVDYDGGGFFDEILEFIPTSGEWSVLENMMKKRAYHAVSVISADKVLKYCYKEK